MYLKRSLNIFTTKFNLVYKLLFYITIIIILTSAVGVSLPSYHKYVNAIHDTNIIQDAKDASSMIVKGDFEGYQKTFEHLEDTFYKAKDKIFDSVQIRHIFLSMLAIIIIAKYLINLSYLPFADVLNKFMHSNESASVSNNFIANLKKSALYSLMEIVILVPIDLLLVFGIYKLGSLLLAAFGIFGMPMIALIGLSIYSLRVNLFAGWLPAMVYDKKSVFGALKHNFKTAKIRFVKTYPIFIIVSIFSMSFYVLFGISTLGLGYYIGLPIILLYFRVLELVTYYNINGYRYYIHPKRVADPVID